MTRHTLALSSAVDDDAICQDENLVRAKAALGTKPVLVHAGISVTIRARVIFMVDAGICWVMMVSLMMLVLDRVWCCFDA